MAQQVNLIELGSETVKLQRMDIINLTAVD